jgi:Na+-translocating ferredoxin:NAD+ oxidoreductase RNF subunit RnfB
MSGTALATVLTASAFMTGLGVALAGGLAVAGRVMHVREDPRLAKVEGLLPQANCGACGRPGCHAFAEALVAGEAEPAQCTVLPREGVTALARAAGVEAGHREKRVARVACAGGRNVARNRARYTGLGSCRAAAVVGGGGKGCVWGCLGLGDCMEVCTFDALTMDSYGLPRIDAARCTACGECVTACPRELISLEPASHQLWVACRNQAPGPEAEAECEVACTACERCVVNAPEGLITIQDHLAVVDYTKNALASRFAIERCPTGAIVWLDDATGPTRGRAAKRIVRHEPLPPGDLQRGAQT